MFKFAAIAAALLASSQFARSANVTIIHPDTVDALNVPAYLGLWYQMAADAIVLNTFEKDAFCATAVYGDNGDGTLSVHNYATIGSASGDKYVIDGYAYQTLPDTEPGQLAVVFDSDDAAPFPAPYWILELGPINSNGLYDYAIVSDNLGSSLFVLARDVDTYNSEYKASVSVTLTKLGFTGFKAPIDLYQGSDCVYESTLRRSKIQTFKKIAATQHVVPTVTALDVGAYMGLWYTTYIDAWVASTTFHNAFCSTAKYTAQPDGTFTVHNAATKDSPSGEIQSIDGYAFIPDAAEPGKLTLHLDGVPHDGTYWVAATGPIVNGQYAYAIVTDSTGVSLYVLARDVEQFAKLYQTAVLAQLKTLGFVGPLLGPVPVQQDATCVYDTVAAQK